MGRPRAAGGGPPAVVVAADGAVVSVFKRPTWRTFRYDFKFAGRRYTGNTYQIVEADAQLVEREKQLQLRHQAGGIGAFFPQETPRFSTWANVFLDYKIKHLDHPDHVKCVTGVLLRFFGGLPKGATRTAERPYHDLRLGDVIADPSIILKMEDWMARRGIGAQSKKHYRSMMRRMYSLAMQPQYRQATGVTVNPFLGLTNDPTPGRTVTLTPAQLRALITHAAPHVRLAIAIAALAPKLRMANVLGLQWTDIAPDPRTTGFRLDVAYYLTVRKHKTVRKTGRPLVTPVSRQLVGILKEAYAQHPESAWVIVFRGDPVHSVRAGVREAAKAAGLVYGRDVEGGIVFYTIRHSAATLISAHENDPLKLRDAMGHTSLATTMKYRHMQPQHERPTLARLAKTLNIGAAFSGPQKRVSRR